MWRLPLLVAAVLLSALGVALSSVTVIPNALLIYNQAPRLRIKGTGFPADLKSLSLEISMYNQAPLQTWVDFVILKDPENEGILLSLRGGKRWVHQSSRRDNSVDDAHAKRSHPPP